MRKVFLKVIAIAVALVLIISTFPLTIFAAATKYETIKDDVPVWSKASSKSTKVYTIADEGTLVEVISSKTNSAGNLWYKLDDGNWVFSGNVKKHKHKGVMCGRATYSYEQKNGSVHTVTEKMPDLCSCGYVVEYQTLTGDEAHTFDANKVCTKCGYKEVHKHKAVACGQIAYSYEQKNDSVHVVTEKIPDLCSCGYVVEYQTLSGDEAHTFDANKVCTKCGYKEVHKHKAVACGQIAYSYEQKNDSVHVVTEKIPDLCSCGYVVEYQTLSGDEAHTFDANKVCTKCGYKEVHKHKAVSCGQVAYSYEQKNDAVHVTTAKTPCLCSCGYVVEYQTAIEEEAHVFGSNETCTKCDYKKPHKHKLDRLESVGSAYLTLNKHEHTFKDEVVEYCACGSVMNQKTLRVNQQHEYDSNGKCVCGYTKESAEHKHIGVVRGDPFTSYSAKDRKTHYVLKKIPKLCECGVAVNFETTVLKEESHHFKNDVCNECKVEKSYGVWDVEASQIVEQAVKGNYSDDVTLAGVVAEIIVGELPYGVGLIADVRDVVADIQNDAGFWTTAIDAAALIPIAGGVIKYADEVSAFKKLSKASEYGIDSYKVLKKSTKGTGLEVHHIVEKRLGEALGWKPNNMASVVLTKGEHRVFTNAWAKQIPYGIDYSQLETDDIWKAAQEVYKEYPELLEAARKTIYK